MIARLNPQRIFHSIRSFVRSFDEKLNDDDDNDDDDHSTTLIMK
jgi:hypothetical protein